MGKLRQNRYETLGNGLVLGNDRAMSALISTYDDRVRVVGQIMNLSYLVIHEAFGGIKGREKLDGLRSAMVTDVTQWPGAVSHWKESASRVKAALANGFL